LVAVQLLFSEYIYYCKFAPQYQYKIKIMKTSETKTKETYTKAMAELEAIVQKLQSENVEVDKLRDLVARAAELLRYCKSALLQTDEEIQKILENIES